MLGALLRRLFGGREAGEDSPAGWEKRAAEYLAANGMRIVARNARTRLGELDIVAVDGEEVVFVEVKARRSREYGGPEYAIDAKKRRRLVRAAKEFIARETLTGRPCRFDAVLIYTGAEPAEFTHIKDAFGERPR